VSARELEIVSGAVIAYRLFDVAYAIDLPKAETLWTERARSSSTRARLSATAAKAMAFGVAPVEVVLDPVSLRLGTATATAGVTVRLYDFGVATIALRLPASGVPWSVFAELMDTTDRCLGTGADTQVWSGLLIQIRTTFADRGVSGAPLGVAVSPVGN